MRISPPLDAREVKAGADLFAIASRYTRLRRSAGQFVGLCPFHSERHPSFYVEPQRKLWKCFGCERGGDIFSFVMLAESCNFLKALRIVADFSSRGSPRERAAKRRAVSSGRRGEAPGPAKQGISHSQGSRASILAKLVATNRRVRAIEALNRRASLELATACEPERSFSLEETK